MQAAHCSSIKTHLFNNIEGSFSKAIDDPWRKRLWRQKLRFFSTSKGLSLPNYLLSTSYHRVSGEPGPGQGRGSIRMRNCDASAAHWSSSKTHLFNNIEGSFSKSRPTKIPIASRSCTPSTWSKGGCPPYVAIPPSADQSLS
jgi:hypothetical protein